MRCVNGKHENCGTVKGIHAVCRLSRETGSSAHARAGLSKCDTTLARQHAMVQMLAV